MFILKDGSTFLRSPQVREATIEHVLPALLGTDKLARQVLCHPTFQRNAISGLLVSFCEVQKGVDEAGALFEDGIIRPPVLLLPTQPSGPSKLSEPPSAPAIANARAAAASLRSGREWRLPPRHAAARPYGRGGASTGIKARAVPTGLWTPFSPICQHYVRFVHLFVGFATWLLEEGLSSLAEIKNREASGSVSPTAGVPNASSGRSLTERGGVAANPGEDGADEDEEAADRQVRAVQEQEGGGELAHVGSD